MAQWVFDALKEGLVTALVLCRWDIEAQFVVEVDTSDIGVGTVLSQRGGSDKSLNPCAYFLHPLTPPERNYDLGD